MPDIRGIAPELRAAAAEWEVVDLLSIDEARAADAASVAAATRACTPGRAGGPVAVEEASFVAGSQGDPTKVRIYRSRQGAGTPGALLFFHGGAFCLGDLETDHLRCLAYAHKTGVTVVSVEYPLAPEHPYPAGLEACIASVGWLRSNAARLGIDENRIGVAGESAGGALAAGVALALRDRGGFELRCQLLLFPVLDYRQTSHSVRRFIDSPAWNSLQTAHMWRLYLGMDPVEFHEGLEPGRAAYAAPGVGHDVAGLPDALVVTAEIDPLRDEGIEYAARLLRAGVPTELHNYPGTFHVFDFAAPRANVSERALHEQVAFIRRHLGARGGR